MNMKGMQEMRPRPVPEAHPLVRKGTMRYSELMVGHLDRTARLNSFSCIFTRGSLLLRLASMMTAATVVSTTAPVPIMTGLPRRVIAAVQGSLLRLFVRLLGLCWVLRLPGGLGNTQMRSKRLPGSLTLSMLRANAAFQSQFTWQALDVLVQKVYWCSVCCFPRFMRLYTASRFLDEDQNLNKDAVFLFTANCVY